MSRPVLLALGLALAGAPAWAQTHDHAGHGTHARHEAPADEHAGHPMEEAPVPSGAPPLPDRQTAPPAPPADYAADRYFGAPAMERARAVLRREHGGMRVAKVMLEEAEYRARSGADGYRWRGEAWWGGDLDRLVIKSEGEGDFGHGAEAAEAQLLWSRAVGPYTDLQVGLRQDFAPRPRTYATLGAETLLPYWIEAGGALFLSDQGDLLARLEGAYDLRLAQRLVLQPRAELEFAAQDVRETRTGSGLSSAELGLRLRYEIRREFAPYVGVSYERSYGDTADFQRAAGERTRRTSFVAGLRAWF